jgi:hypothetical protein
VFPLARKELPGQLERIGFEALAQALRDVIHAAPRLDELEAGVHVLDGLTTSLDLSHA